MATNLSILSSMSDQELLVAYNDSKGSSYAGELYKRYVKLVFGVCMNYLKNQTDAEDAVMDIFEKVLTKAGKANVQNFKNWLFILTRNHCLNQRRSKYLEVATDIFENIPGTEVEFGDDSGLHKEEMLVRLEKAILQLSLPQKQCIEMFYFEKKSYTEIQDRTGYDYKAVKSHLQHGKKNLFKLLKE